MSSLNAMGNIDQLFDNHSSQRLSVSHEMEKGKMECHFIKFLNGKHVLEKTEILQDTVIILFVLSLLSDLGFPIVPDCSRLFLMKC
jgi:hypothetical protein